MSVDICVLDDRGILVVTYSSEEVTPEALAEQRRLVADAISSNALKKVLIDTSALTRFPSTMAIFTHNAAVSKDSILQQTKFAVVCNTLGKDERFLETTGLNRNIQIKCFTSKESALSWLDG